jgi:hypothetical protein
VVLCCGGEDIPADCPRDDKRDRDVDTQVRRANPINMSSEGADLLVTENQKGISDLERVSWAKKL